MGLYDRDYVRYHHVRLANPLGPRWRTAGAFWIIAITVGVFFLQLILRSAGADRYLYCSPDRVVRHFELWRLLTAAFCHATSTIWHLAWNMLIVFFFGPQIERLYGRRDFIAFYLTAAVFGNLVYCVLPFAVGGNPYGYVLGASGACMALIVLCALYFPNQTVIFFFIPMPLWLLGALLVLGDLVGFLNPRSGGPIAYSVHLAGAAVGAAYRYFDLRLSTVLARLEKVLTRRRARRLWAERLKRTEPPGGGPRFIEDIENQRLDRILEKISRFGRESLTQEELEFLQRMSERYRGRG